MSKSQSPSPLTAKFSARADWTAKPVDTLVHLGAQGQKLEKIAKEIFQAHGSLQGFWDLQVAKVVSEGTAKGVDIQFECPVQQIRDLDRQLRTGKPFDTGAFTTIFAKELPGAIAELKETYLKGRPVAAKPAL